MKAIHEIKINNMIAALRLPYMILFAINFDYHWDGKYIVYSPYVLHYDNNERIEVDSLAAAINTVKLRQKEVMKTWTVSR